VTCVTEDERDAAPYAADIEAARDRLIAFASGCSEAEWRAAPLAGDPRPVAVVVDHVADSYEYVAGWIRQVVAGQAAEVTGEMVDDLNAEHAAGAAAVSQADAAEHLRRSGAAISALIASLSADELAAGDGRVRLFAQIAIRHADNHRTDIETALAAQGLPRNIGAPATRALTAAGYTELRQLADVPVAELKKLHGVGPKALRLLQEALEQQGLSLR
jgi:hypothetical protein